MVQNSSPGDTMKRLALVFILFLTPFFIFAGGKESFSFAFMGNASGETVARFSVSASNEKDEVAVAFDEKKTALSYERSGAFTPAFPYSCGLYLSRFSDGASSALIHSIIHYDFGWSFLRFCVGLGVQGGVVNYDYLDDILYSLSPLFSSAALLEWGKNSFVLSFSFLNSNERSLKAVPTISALYKRELSSSLGFSLEVWGRNAEYMMDPWVSFSRFGVKGTVEVRGK